MTDPPDSWAEFFAVPEGSDGSIGMMNDQVEVVHAVLRAVGATPCSTDPADYARAEELLDDFKSGGVGDQLRRDHRTDGRRARTRSTWSGTVPRTARRWKTPTLSTSIQATASRCGRTTSPFRAGAPNLEQAKVFINWMMDPRNIAEATNWNAYGNAIVGSDAYVDPDLASSPMVVPGPEELAFAAPVESCSIDAIDLV